MPPPTITGGPYVPLFWMRCSTRIKMSSTVQGRGAALGTEDWPVRQYAPLSLYGKAETPMADLRNNAQGRSDSLFQGPPTKEVTTLGWGGQAGH